MLVVQEGSCKLYEMYDAHRKGTGWGAASGAVFNLRSDALRPEGWTSADAAGLPIFPLLARYPEVSGGTDRPRAARDRAEHAERLHPPGDALRVHQLEPEPAADGPAAALEGELQPRRLHGESLVILEALKRYGLIVADNGSPWFITGAPDPGWNDEDLEEIKRSPARNSKPSKAARSCTADRRRFRGAACCASRSD